MKDEEIYEKRSNGLWVISGIVRNLPDKLFKRNVEEMVWKLKKKF